MSLDDNPNTNCLDGMRCPECGSYKPFDIVVGCIARTFDSGVEHTWDFDWSFESSCTCVICGHHGQVKDFKEDDCGLGSMRDAAATTIGTISILTGWSRRRRKRQRS
jgi:hypothetical protein